MKHQMKSISQAIRHNDKKITLFMITNAEMDLKQVLTLTKLLKILCFQFQSSMFLPLIMKYFIFWNIVSFIY